LKPLAFRRNKFSIVAERLVIPANPPKEDKSRNPGKMELGILDAPGLQIAGAGLSVIPDLIRDRHDTIVDINQPY
jgi:hypothetical protein